MLFRSGQVAASDRRAQFVGPEAYTEAGGVITRDLFDDENGGYFADAALLDRLVLAKLEQEAQAVRAEGWAWVIVTPEFDFRATSDMRRVYPTEPDIGAKNQRKIEKLGLEYDELVAVAEKEEMTEVMQARLNELEAAIAALKGEPVYDPADIAAGGAFVSFGFDGGVRVERGLIRKADEAPGSQRRAAEPNSAAEGRETPTALSERLVAQLTAQRTAALREAVAHRPDVAFIAVVHALAASVFYVGNRISCFDVTARPVYLSGHAAGIDESPLGRACSDGLVAEGAAVAAARQPRSSGGGVVVDALNRGRGRARGSGFLHPKKFAALAARGGSPAEERCRSSWMKRSSYRAFQRPHT